MRYEDDIIDVEFRVINEEPRYCLALVEVEETEVFFDRYYGLVAVTRTRYVPVIVEVA